MTLSNKYYKMLHQPQFEREKIIYLFLGFVSLKYLYKNANFNVKKVKKKKPLTIAYNGKKIKNASSEMYKCDFLFTCKHTSYCYYY